MKNELLKKFLITMKQNKKLEVGIYCVIGLLIIIIYFSGPFADKSQQSEQKQESQESLESKLEHTLSQINGAGQVSVMITYETSAELVPAMTIENQASRPVTIQKQGGGNEPLIVMEREPKARGVIVVAEGARDVGVRIKITRAIQAVLNVPSSNIEVLEMKSKKKGY